MATSDGAVKLDIVAGSTSQFQKSAENAVASVSKSIGKLTKGFAAAILGGSLTKFAMDCAQVAASAQDTANRVNTVFPSMAENVNAFAASAIEKMGMTAGAAKNMTAKFGLMAQGMGYSESASAAMGEQMTTLAGDIAAFYGTTTDEAMSKLTGVFTGMTRGFKQLGVNMSETNLQAHALSLGITTDVSAMSDAELAALRLSYAQKQLSIVQGYAEKHTQTYSGQVTMLQQRFTALKAALGKSFAAVLLPIIKILNAIVLAATRAANAFNAMIESITGKKFSEILGGAQGAVLDLSETSEDAASSTSSLAEAQEAAEQAAKNQNKAQKDLNRTLAGFDKINKLSSDSDSLGATTATTVSPTIDVSGLTGVTTAAEEANKALGSIQVPERVTAALQRLGDAFERIKTVLGGGLKQVWDAVAVPISNWTINELLPRILEMIANALETIAIVCEKLAPVFQAVWDTFFQPLIEFVGSAIGNAIIGFLDSFNAGWSELNETASQADFSELVEAIYEFKNTDPAAFDLIAGAIAGVILVLTGHPIIALLMGIATVAKVIYENWDGIVEFFQGVWDGISEAFKNVKEWFKEKFEGARDNIKNAFSNIKQWFVDRYNDITGAFKNIPNWFGEKFAAAKKAVTDKFGAIKQWFTDVRKSIYERISGVVTGIPGYFEKARINAVKKFQDIKQWFTDVRKSIYERISGVVTGIPNYFDKARKGAIDKFQGIRQWFTDTRNNIYSRIAGIPDGFKSTFQGAYNKVTGIFKNLPTYFSNLWAKIKTSFSSLGTKIGNAMSSAFKNGLNRIISGAQNTINKAIGLINGAIGIINKLPGVKISKIGNVSFPRLAQGGFVARNTPQLAVVGDNTREGEIVAPESKLRALAQEAASNADMSEVTSLLRQLIQVVQSQDTRTYLDGRDITRYVVNAVNQQTQSTGRCPITI